MDDQKYQKAAQQKLRFETPQGYLMVEDLFDLPLQSMRGRANLDDIAKDLDRVIKSEAGQVTSFVDDTRAPGSQAQLAFDIVIDVIGIKKAENAAKAQVEANRARKRQIMEILEGKRNEALTQKSIEELDAELAKL